MTTQTPDGTPPPETTHCRACGGTGEFDSGQETYTCGVCGGLGEHPTDLEYGVTGTAEHPPVHYPETADPQPVVATVAATTSGPGYKAYSESLTRLHGLERLAGAMLAQSLRADHEHPEVPRRMAEEYARECNDLSAWLKAWRLANGYES